jgi:transposase
MTTITLLTGERRRVWSAAEKAQILDDAFAPGANTLEVSRRYGVSSGQVYTWRAKARRDMATGFVEAVVVNDAARSTVAHGAAIQVELASARVSLSNAASPVLVEAVLRALR